jgi:hypothetical protein
VQVGLVTQLFYQPSGIRTKPSRCKHCFEPHKSPLTKPADLRLTSTKVVPRPTGKSSCLSN